jgi:site-specific DNA-methyltransferase (adenine-specific)
MSQKHVPYKTISRQDWQTPKELLEALDQEFDFDQDVTPPPSSENGGLHDRDWLGSSWESVNYCNPPYDNQDAWVEKAIEEQEKGKTTVMLLPADTSTQRFHHLIVPHAEVRFIEGRLSFDDSGGAAPFASMVCVFYGDNEVET